MSPLDASAPWAVVETEVVAPGVPGPGPLGARLRVLRPTVDGWEGRPGLLALDDSGADGVAAGLAACGAVVVSPVDPLPASLPEALTAVQSVLAWVRASACDLGFDPDCLGVLGSGTVAHLAPFAALYDSEGTHPPLRWAVALAGGDWPSGLPVFLPDDRPPTGLPRLWIGQLGQATDDGRPMLHNWLRAYLVAGGDAELEVFAGNSGASAISRIADFLARQAPALVPFAGA